MNGNEIFPGGNIPDEYELSSLTEIVPPDMRIGLRPPENKRNFTSDLVNREIMRITDRIADKNIAHMFENCWPNTLDTAVDNDGFVTTGDIPVMWLRDSSAQMLSYLTVVDSDPQLKNLYRSVIERQAKCITVDPYAQAFNKDYSVADRRWELDSLCWFLRLSNKYYEQTNDRSIFTRNWEKAADTIVETLKAELGNGLIHSAHRPSDWITTHQFLIPSNIFATIELDNLVNVYDHVYKDIEKASACEDLSIEVKEAVIEYGTTDHPKYGLIYKYETDALGQDLLMDDSNIPSLLSLPYLDPAQQDDPIYQNTRRFVLSSDNPSFVQGKLGKGIGSYNGSNQFWPMSLCVQGLTTDDKVEIKECLDILMNSHSGTFFMHESVQKDGENSVITDGIHVDETKNYTRPWFCWANGLFGELILKIDAQYPDLLI